MKIICEMETIYFPCDPATQSDPSDLAGTLQLSHRRRLLLRCGDSSGLAADREHHTTLDAACAGVADSYQIWQGTYSALFLMYLAPNVFPIPPIIW